MKTIKVVLSNERLASTSGVAIAGNMLVKSGLAKAANEATVTDKRSQPQIKTGDILHTYIGLLCIGQTAFDSVVEMEDDPEFFMRALHIKRDIPSAAILRQRMDDIGDSLRKVILESNVNMFKKCDIVPGKLGSGHVPVDIDVTPFDNSGTSKAGVSRTYKGYDGYAPIMAYIGTEGYLANTELREGKQHCQNHTPEFLRETLGLCHKLTEEKLLIRMDSGNDAAENLGILMDDKSEFIIKRNLRRGETNDDWLAIAKEEHSIKESPRLGKDIYIGSKRKDITYTASNGEEKTASVRIVFEVIERDIDKHGQLIMPSDIEVATYWTTLDLPEKDIIELYHRHGESEQYHSEIKTDMDVERLPSGKFATNALVLELTLIAYNILRSIGQNALKSGKMPNRKRDVGRLRLRTVIHKLMYHAGHVTRHARDLVLSLGCSDVWRNAFQAVYQKMA